jgi:DNA topoisomerase-1
VGRVQSPTLALIVDREKEIRAFVPTPYWEVSASVHKESAFDVQHDHGRFLDERKAKAAHEKAAAAKTGRVTSVDRSKRTLQPPTPFSTTDYQRAAAALGYSIKRADSLAESLYTQGFTSYPRTSNTVYPESLDLKEILEKLAAPGSPFAKEARAVLDAGPLHPTRGKKTDPAHPPIHPVEVAKPTDLGGPEWRVYELIVRRFLATLSDAAVVERVKAGFDIAGEPFSANGQRLVEPGFLAVYPYSSRQDVILPALAEGETVQVRGAELHAKQTQPPSRLTQARLVQEMENLNLGTKATRGDIIQKLYDRDFVRNKTPEPTEVGFAMIDTLEQYASLVAKPDMTSQLEEEMDKIAEGRLELANVVEDSRTMLTQVLHDLDENRDAVGNGIRKAIETKNTLGTCPKSGHPLVMRRSKAGKRFVGCAGWPNCDVTYPLPQFGKIVADHSLCPCPGCSAHEGACGAPVIRVMNNPRRPPWVTCLTIGCKGAEEREQALRDHRKAEREAAAATEKGDEDEATSGGPVSDEDIGVAEEG